MRFSSYYEYFVLFWKYHFRVRSIFVLYRKGYFQFHIILMKFSIKIYDHLWKHMSIVVKHRRWTPVWLTPRLSHFIWPPYQLPHAIMPLIYACCNTQTLTDTLKYSKLNCIPLSKQHFRKDERIRQNLNMRIQYRSFHKFFCNAFTRHYLEHRSKCLLYIQLKFILYIA